MKVLVTAGNTLVPIDQVRAITNIFKGRTGASIAFGLATHGHNVTLVASNVETATNFMLHTNQQRLLPYKTYEDLLRIMQEEITFGGYDVVIHSAAVSDYYVDGVCVKNASGELIDIPKDGKVGSDHDIVYLRMRQTQKIIDLIRSPWGFKGYLVKFKLQVGISDEELIAIAKKSRVTSEANLIVANCLEWSGHRAFIIDDDNVTPVGRADLPLALNEAIKKWKKGAVI